MILKLEDRSLDLGEQVTFSSEKIEVLNHAVDKIVPHFYVFPHYNPVYRPNSTSCEALMMCAINNLYALMVDCGKVLNMMCRKNCVLLTDREKEKLSSIKDLICCLRSYHDHNAANQLHRYNQENNERAEKWLASEDWPNLLLKLVEDGEAVFQIVSNGLNRFRKMCPSLDRDTVIANWREAMVSVASDGDLVYKRLQMVYGDTQRRSQRPTWPPRQDTRTLLPSKRELGNWLKTANETERASFTQNAPKQVDLRKLDRQKQKDELRKQSEWYVDEYKSWVENQVKREIEKPETVSYMPEELLSTIMEPLRSIHPR